MTLDQAFAALRERDEPVPTPARLPTEAEIVDAEEILDVKLHPDFRRYLLEASNVHVGAMEPVTLRPPEAHTDLLQVCESAWEEMEVPRNLVPICEDNGDYYCMNKKGQIVFWSSDGASDEKWANLATWIEEVWIGESDEEEEESEDEE
jgi:hypothetical protein